MYAIMYPQMVLYCTGRSFKTQLADQVGDSVAMLYLEHGIPMVDNDSIAASRKAHSSIMKCDFSNKFQQDIYSHAKLCLQNMY
jgi:hypothetical protein